MRVLLTGRQSLVAVDISFQQIGLLASACHCVSSED